MADRQKVVYDLLNSIIFNDLEPPLPPVSISRLSLMLNISEMVQRTDIVSMNTNRDLHVKYLAVSFRMTLCDLAKYSVTRSVALFLCDSSASYNDQVFRTVLLASC